MKEGSPIRFEGFERPRYTPVPDALFDALMPQLTDNELRALLYIVRRTFGWKKDLDAISFNQFLSGIKRKNGPPVDLGCGITNRTRLSQALQSLEEKQVIFAIKDADENGTPLPTVYGLRFKGETVPERHYGSTGSSAPMVPDRHPQETLETRDMTQEGDSNSSPHPEVLDVLDSYIGDFGREWRDQAPRSSVTRAYKIYQASGLDLDTFVERMYEARRKTKASANVKNKMGFFFTTLENELK